MRRRRRRSCRSSIAIVLAILVIHITRASTFGVPARESRGWSRSHVWHFFQAPWLSVTDIDI